MDKQKILDDLNAAISLIDEAYWLLINIPKDDLGSMKYLLRSSTATVGDEVGQLNRIYATLDAYQRMEQEAKPKD